MNRMAIVLAAGEGKRMKSNLHKVLHAVCGVPMIGHVLEMLKPLQTTRTVVVVGHGADDVRGYLGNRAEYAMQEQQLGTGHAVLQAKELLELEEGMTFVIYGDTPCLKRETLQHMAAVFQQSGAAAVMLTAIFDEPFGFGRVVRDSNGGVSRIVEQKDCAAREEEIREINAGTYCFDNRKLFQALQKVTNNNAQKEYYFTDVISILHTQGERIETYCTDDPTEAIGINDRAALAEAEQIMRARINRGHMMNGVTMIDPAHTYIDKDVVIGADSVIYPGVLLRGRTTIGRDCRIGPNAEIIDSTIADHVHIQHAVLSESIVGGQTKVGPYAYLRPGTKLGENVKIGDFVEIKNAVVQDGSKVSHLSYVGDADIGKNVNFGCGAITVNYDGYNKQRTQVEDDAFIGSNVNLIAPVKIGKGAYVVAGSTITQNVEENDLAIARERQTNKPGYAEKIRNRMKDKAIKNN